MGKTGVINRDFTGEENNVYHDVIRLFKIYRAVKLLSQNMLTAFFHGLSQMKKNVRLWSPYIIRF